MSDKETLSEALEEFSVCEDAESENRQQWLDDVRFARLGEQWPVGVKRQREIEGRPCLTGIPLSLYKGCRASRADPSGGSGTCTSIAREPS